MLSFIKKVYRSKRKDYLLLLCFMSILASFEFCSLAIYSAVNAFDLDPYVAIAINALPTISTFIALLLSIFILKYFIENKKQEFAILLLSGRSPKELFIYLMTQFGTLSCLAFLIGIGGGVLCMKTIQKVILELAFTFEFHYSFLMTTVIHFWFLIITILLTLAICANQFVMMDKDLVNFLSHKQTTGKAPYKISLSAMSSLQGKPARKKIPFFAIIQSILILIITGYSCYMLVHAHFSSGFVWLHYLFALGGMEVIVNQTIPMLYDVCHHQLLKHPLLLNALACFNDFSSTMITLVNLNAILIPTMAFLVIMSGQSLFLQAIVVPCFVMALIMSCLCFVLRYSFYIQHIHQSIATYHAIGYHERKLQHILSMKNVIFAILGIILPFLLFVLLIYKAYLESYLSFYVCFGLSLLYIVLYLCIFIYMFIKERKMLMEVTSHVKYLNRSE